MTKLLKILLVLFMCILFICCNEENRYKEEYEKVSKSFPHKFANSGTTVIYNVNKEYLISACWSSEGFGLGLKDLSKMGTKDKVILLKTDNDIQNIGSEAQYEWLNAYVHEAIDNYNNYGETFLLIWPHSQQFPNPPKQ